MAAQGGSPVVATMIGDPAGIGPEVCVRAAVEDGVRAAGRHLLVGSADTVRAAVAACGMADRVEVNPISEAGEAGYARGSLDVLDTGELAPGAVTVGRPSAEAGRAVVAWMRTADQLAASGAAQASIIAPIDSSSLKLAGVAQSIDDFQPEGTTMFRVSGNLRVAALSEHIPISAVPADVNTAHILEVLGLVNDCLTGWGTDAPRYAVAGLNPHAMGREDDEEISPAVEEARAGGLDVTGPVSPDSVFRQCLEGSYDVVLSMYHDQGQIPLKTAAFEGACTIYLGLPYVRLTIPHGTAYDIAGRGTAQHRSMAAAMTTAASLAAGRGFPTLSRGAA